MVDSGCPSFSIGFPVFGLNLLGHPFGVSCLGCCLLQAEDQAVGPCLARPAGMGQVELIGWVSIWHRMTLQCFPGAVEACGANGNFQGHRGKANTQPTAVRWLDDMVRARKGREEGKGARICWQEFGMILRKKRKKEKKKKKRSLAELVGHTG